MSDNGEERLAKAVSECDENDPQKVAEAASPSKRKVTMQEDGKSNSDNSVNIKRRKSEDNPTAISTNNVVDKRENPDAELTKEAETSSKNIPVKIKTEPVVTSDNVPVASTSSSSVESKAEASNIGVVVKTQPATSSTAVVKTEPTDNNNAALADSSVSSSTLRLSCRFGIRCYRRNPVHRQTEAHPGDPDYRRPSFPTPPLGTPPCTFGNACYRRNPVHFQQFSHPPDFNSAQNVRNRLRQRCVQTQNTNGLTNEYSDLESDEEEDPFYDQGDSDLDYNPDVQEDNDDEEDDLEFDSERQNCDAFD